MQKKSCNLKLVVLMEGLAIICKGEFKVKTTHPSSSWLVVTVGLQFHATCQLLKYCRCLRALDWFFGLVDCLLFEACWTSCTLFLWFYSCVYFTTEARWCKIFAWFDFNIFCYWSFMFMIFVFFDHFVVGTKWHDGNKIVWWNCPSTRKWSYCWSCVWCFNLQVPNLQQ